MPNACGGCHAAAIAIAHGASAIRDLGAGGALSIGAAFVPRVGCKRAVSDATAARSASSDGDAMQTHVPGGAPVSASSSEVSPCLTN